MVMWSYQMEPLMVGHHPTKFGGHQHWGSGYIMFLVVERQYSTSSHLNPLLLFISKAHGTQVMVAHTKFDNKENSEKNDSRCPIKKIHPGATLLVKKLMPVHYRNSGEKEEKKRKKQLHRQLQNFLRCTQKQTVKNTRNYSCVQQLA